MWTSAHPEAFDVCFPNEHSVWVKKCGWRGVRRKKKQWMEIHIGTWRAAIPHSRWGESLMPFIVFWFMAARRNLFCCYKLGLWCWKRRSTRCLVCSFISGPGLLWNCLVKYIFEMHIDLGRLGVLMVATPLCDITMVIRQTLLEKVAQGKSVWRILRGELWVTQPNTLCSLCSTPIKAALTDYIGAICGFDKVSESSSTRALKRPWFSFSE